MSILITGAAGFIGYSVARRLLETGERVIGIDNLNAYYDPRLKKARLSELFGLNRGFCFLKLDFADPAALADALAEVAFDEIIHLGAQAGVRYSIDNPEAFIQANIVGHLNMLEVARRHQVRHFIYASSSSVYGSAAKLPLSVESRVDNPISLYAATKRADELITESYAHLYRIPATGLRFFTVYGPWGRPDMAMWTFAERILSGAPIKVFNHGRMRRDFTYIDDIVSGVIACRDTPPQDDGERKAGGSRTPHRIYNLGNSRSEELLNMIALLERACGRAAIVEMLPMQPGDVTETFADIEPSRIELGFQPLTRLEEGVPRFVEWYRAYRLAQ